MASLLCDTRNRAANATEPVYGNLRNTQSLFLLDDNISLDRERNESSGAPTLQGLLSSAIEDPPSPHPTDEKGTGDEPEMSENRRSSTLLLETVRPAMETKNR
jgi:hypothetical protein